MNEVQKAPEIDPKQRALIDTVRKTIFPTATDAELALFFHKCNVVGVNPLDQLIHPTKFNDKDGSSKVVFITSINLLRSKSDETGLYDGMDRPAYGPEVEFQDEGGQVITVPEWAEVSVYRKDVGRPFVGTARWKEYYPGQKKGHQWRQRPYVMLTKCAEALARRLAFPDKLNKLYTDEEMMLTFEGMAGVPQSTKPAVNPADVRVDGNETSLSQLVGQVDEVKIAEGKTRAGKAWKKYGVTIDGTTYGTFDSTLGESALKFKGMIVAYTFTDDGKYKTLTFIEAKTLYEANSGTAPAVEGDEEFRKKLLALCTAKCITEAKADSILFAEFQCNLNTIPANSQEAIIEHFGGL